MCNVQNELREILPEFLPLPYFDAKPLSMAPKPLSAHLFSYMSLAGTLVQQKWHGRQLRLVTEALLNIGYAINSCIAFAETVASVAVAVFLTQIHVSMKDYTNFFEKRAIKAWGYSLHGVAIIASQGACAFMRHPMLHSAYALFSNCSHIFAATLGFALMHQDKIEEALADSIYTFVEKGALVELLHALDRDFGEGATKDQLKELLGKQSIKQFISTQEGLEVFIEELDLIHLLDSQFIAVLKHLAQEFVRFTYHPTHVVVVEEVDYGENETDPYRQQLIKYVKTAFTELRDTFSKEEIADLDPCIFVPIAIRAQLLEIKDDTLHCPETFSKHLAAYNPRREQILEAKRLYKEQGESSKDFRLKLEALASSLYTGKLMTQPMVNHWTDYHSSRHLFREAITNTQ